MREREPHEGGNEGSPEDRWGFCRPVSKEEAGRLVLSRTPAAGGKGVDGEAGCASISVGRDGKALLYGEGEGLWAEGLWCVDDLPIVNTIWISVTPTTVQEQTTQTATLLRGGDATCATTVRRYMCLSALAALPSLLPRSGCAGRCTAQTRTPCRRCRKSMAQTSAGRQGMGPICHGAVWYVDRRTMRFRQDRKRISPCVGLWQNGYIPSTRRIPRYWAGRPNSLPPVAQGQTRSPAGPHHRLPARGGSA